MKTLQTTGKYKLSVQVDDDWADRLQFARLYGVPGKREGDFYVSVVLPGGRAEFLSRLIMQPPPGMQVDHLDYDPLNNTRANLWVCTPAQNMQRSRFAPGKSGFIGVAVSRGAAGVFYRAHIKVNRKRVDLGRSATPDGAARIYDAGARHFYGPHARVNFPGEPVTSLDDARTLYARNARRGRPATTETTYDETWQKTAGLNSEFHTARGASDSQEEEEAKPGQPGAFDFHATARTIRSTLRPGAV